MNDDPKDKRNAYEDTCLRRLGETLPAGFKVTILEDRGLGDTKLFGYLGTLGFDYVIRFRGATYVTATTGERRPAADWVGKGGRVLKLSGAMVTAAEHPVGAVVCVAGHGHEESSCLATTLGNSTAREIVDASARRWTIEPSFRYTKAIRFGMGLFLLRISRLDRRDRLLVLMPSRFTCSRCWAPPARNSGWAPSQFRHQHTPHTFPLSLRLHAYDRISDMPEVRLRPLISSSALQR